VTYLKYVMCNTQLMQAPKKSVSADEA